VCECVRIVIYISIRDDCDVCMWREGTCASCRAGRGESSVQTEVQVMYNECCCGICID
jgi:hypothetical protein